nr:hypothetical protein HmN_000247100 [Hymenolepis microstoma]
MSPGCQEKEEPLPFAISTLRHLSAQLSAAAPCLPPPHTPFSPASTRYIPTHRLSSWAHDAHRHRRLSEPSSSTSSLQSSACLSPPNSSQRVHAFLLRSIQSPFQSQRLCDTNCHVEVHDGVAKGAGEGDDDGDDDNNDDVVDEAANQLFRLQLGQYDCKTFSPSHF